MKREQKMGAIGLMLIAVLFLGPLFQNCSKTSYDLTNNGSNSVTGTGSSKKVTLDPSFNQNKANLKVLFIVDDSYTMSQSQLLLANAIDSLLNPLQGHNVSFKIVSTSGVPSNEVDYSISTKYMTEQKMEIPQSQTASMTSYLIEKNILTRSAASRHNNLQLFRQSTTTQFNILKDQIKDAILDVGVSGSDTEEGICAAARQLFDESSNRFFQPGDKAAVVILSDENDASVFSKCVTRYVQRVSSSPVVYYSYGQQRAKLALEFQLTRDGVTDWYPVIWGVGLSGDQTIVNGNTCSGTHQTFAENKIVSQGYTIQNVTSCVYETVPASYYGSDLGDSGADVNKNLCTSSFYYNNVYYTNLYNMVNNIGLSAAPNSCVKQVLPGNSLSNYIDYDPVIESDDASTSSQNISQAVKNKSVELFGSSGFTFASIIREPLESCNLDQGQSYGQAYEGLSQLIGSNAIVQSMCNSDFSSTLSQVSNFMVTEANSSYVISGMKDSEAIISVTILRGSESILLTTSQYEAVRSTLTLTNFTLQSGDKIVVEVGTVN